MRQEDGPSTLVVEHCLLKARAKVSDLKQVTHHPDLGNLQSLESCYLGERSCQALVFGAIGTAECDSYNSCSMVDIHRISTSVAG